MSIRKCPQCTGGKLSVIDSRAVGDGEACRRRYQCSCGVRFTTFEVVMDDDETRPIGRADGKKGTQSQALGLLAVRRIVGDSAYTLDELIEK